MILENKVSPPNKRDHLESVISILAVFPWLIVQFTENSTQKAIIGVAAIIIFSFKKHMAHYIIIESSTNILLRFTRGLMVSYLCAMYMAVICTTFISQKYILTGLSILGLGGSFSLVFLNLIKNPCTGP
jgi:hypothetical protein